MLLLIEFGVPVCVVAAYELVLFLVLRSCGLPLFYLGRVSHEKAVAWRRVRRWQFVILNGILSYTLPMLLCFGVRNYLKLKFDPHYGAPRYDLWSVLIIVATGLWIGFSRWKKVWNPAFDLPTSV